MTKTKTRTMQGEETEIFFKDTASMKKEQNYLKSRFCKVNMAQVKN